jgi:peptide/nickel transport system substrate-binding protein
MSADKFADLSLSLSTSRREFLKRAMVIGLAIPAGGALLAACDTDDADDDTPAATDDTEDVVDDPDEEDEEEPVDDTDVDEEEPDDEPEDDEEVLDTDDEEPADVDGPILQFGMNAADLGTLDPHFSATTNDRTVVDLIFNGLLRYKPGDSNEFEPDLATEVPQAEETDDGQVWRFQIREGVMTHPHPDVDSYEITADDILFSLERSADPDRSAYAGEYTGMTFEKVDDYTVDVIVEQPLSEVLFLPKFADYAGGFIVPQQAAEAIGDDSFQTNPVGTGPFRFEGYTPQDRIRLLAHEDYFRGQPQLGGVDLRFVPDDSSRELALQTGELHVINGPADAVWIDRIDALDDISVDVFGVGEVTFLAFNTEAEPFDDIRVRQAIAYAIDRDEHLALFGEPAAQNVYSLVPDQLLDGGLSEEEARDMDLTFDYDPDRAMELLEEAGYGDGFQLELVSSESESYLRNYESMQAELAAVGIDLQLQVVDHSTMHEQIRQEVNPIVIYIAWRPNADVYLTRFTHSSTRVQIGDAPDTNFTRYTELDDLIEEARVETDPDRQIEIWKEANAQLLEDMVIYPLHFLNQVYARRDSVDYGHELVSVMGLTPQITENTTLDE